MRDALNPDQPEARAGGDPAAATPRARRIGFAAWTVGLAAALSACSAIVLEENELAAWATRQGDPAPLQGEPVPMATAR